VENYSVEISYQARPAAKTYSGVDSLQVLSIIWMAEI
jgi:hypothetical protein